MARNQEAVNSSKILRNVRICLTRNQSLVVYKGSPTEGAPNISNSAVEERIAGGLATTEEGALTLPVDENFGSTWRTRTDENSAKRRQLLTELIADYLHTFVNS